MSDAPASRRLVRDAGRADARIVVIGEAPGVREDAQGIPFVGPSGWKLDAWLQQAGLSRSACYITNVYPYRPPNNNLATIPKGELDHWVDQLHDRLAALASPHVLVPTGGTALRALVGRESIVANRGFIDTYTDRRGRVLKVVPTLHPAAIFKAPAWERRSRLDWRRIAAEAAFPDVRLPAWTHFTTPTLADVDGFLADATREARALSIDIETPGGAIRCVGFAYESDFSFTIPTTLDFWGSSAQLDAAWQRIRALCALPCAKILQYGFFDTYWLLDHACPVVNWIWDPGAQHHCLDAADDHDLGYMASVDLRMAPWKHMPKDTESKTWGRDAAALREYNGIDVCVQWLLADLYAGRLAAAQRMTFFRAHYVAMFGPLLRMMRHGVAIDAQRRHAQFVELVGRCRRLQADLLTHTGGVDLFGKQSNKDRMAGKIQTPSPKKTGVFFYEQLKLPRHTRRRASGAVTVSVDEVAIRQIMIHHDQRVRRAVANAFSGVPQTAGPLRPDVTAICQGILEHRRTKKLSEFLAEGRVDADGRMRSSYGFAPETGRLSSSKNPKHTGANAQNQDREIRGIFVPDPGCLFLEVDASQAEDRMVKAMAASLLPPGARRDELLWRARALPWENDEHRRAAAAIYKVDEAAVTSPQRYIGKRVRHAGNYDMHGRRLSEELLKEGVTITAEEGQQMIDTVIDQDTPEVRVWQQEVRRLLMRDRRLINAWGRELSFAWDRLDDDTYRRGYAFLPQSSLPAIVNIWGMIPLDAAIAAGRFRAAVNINGHDSLLVSVVPEDAWAVWQFLKAQLEQPVKYWNVELTIPVTAKIGCNWAFDPGVEFKRGPTEEEFRAALHTYQ